MGAPKRSLRKGSPALNFLKTEIVRELLGEPNASRDLAAPALAAPPQPPSLLGVYGPPLLRKPTQPAPLARGDEAEHVKRGAHRLS